MTIIADPRFQISYVSCYFIGIERAGYNLKFNIIKDFPLVDEWQLQRGMPLVANGKKYFFDVHDASDVDEVIYDWCDVYAKINVNEPDAEREKMTVLGPNFSVRVDNPIRTVILGIVNYVRAFGHWNDKVHPSFFFFMKGYLYTLYRRKRYSVYSDSFDEDKDYVFSMNTLWYDPFTVRATNRYRYAFMMACKRYVKEFEGGFFYIGSKSVRKYYPNYKDYLERYKGVLWMKRISMNRYLKNIKRSAFVFNTPAVCGCHGWKLGEYLALNKAIISTPLTRVMPGDFQKDKHYICVTNEKEIEEAVLMLSKDPELAQLLKRNVHEYYEKWIAPEAVVRRVFGGKTTKNPLHG
ncbi:MAG: hypothetical protein KBT29_01715 [Prevotellaceae bacterium]|nr:hypothetical protein [Candidatus Minthosoma caballi]